MQCITSLYPLILFLFCFVIVFISPLPFRENLLFIIEALQYRYRIPQSLFEEEDPPGHTQENQAKFNKNESCELLMHVIHQNKKLPISKTLQDHIAECIHQRAQRAQQATAALDTGDITHLQLSDIGKNAISLSRGSCCKSCVVHKFQYIMAKYVQTPSGCKVNLSHAVQSKLKYIYGQLLIEDPQQRFIKTTVHDTQSSKSDKRKRPQAPSSSDSTSKSSPIMAIANKFKLSRRNSGSKIHHNENESGSSNAKSPSDLVMNREGRSSTPRISLESIRKAMTSKNKKRDARTAEEILSEEITSDDQIGNYRNHPLPSGPVMENVVTVDTASADTTPPEHHGIDCAAEMDTVESLHGTHPMAAQRQVTDSNLSLNDSRHFWHQHGNHSADNSNQSHQSLHTKDRVPSTTASPRMIGNLRHSLTDKGLTIQVPIADNPSTSVADTPSQHFNSENNTPITKATVTTSSGHSRSNEKTPSLKPVKAQNNMKKLMDDTHHLNHSNHSNHEHDRLSPDMMEHKMHDSFSRTSCVSSASTGIVEIAEDDTSPNTQPTAAGMLKVTLPHFGDSANECNDIDGINCVHIEDEKELESQGPLKEPLSLDDDVKDVDLQCDDDDEAVNRTADHDGFGNIDYLRVFDDAVLELIRLIKADTWRRFKQSQQFKDWVDSFKAS